MKPLNDQFAAYLAECPIMAILRGITPAETAAACEALYEAGVRLLEIPLNSPDPLDGIRIAAGAAEGRMLVGAGTVLTPAEVENVAAAGGRFVISPNVDAAVIRATKAAGMVSLPGFLTPTEGFAALAAGADYLKLFPAGRLGRGYIKDLQAVIKAPILAVGGVDATNLREFLDCCAGVGLGGALYRPGGTPEALRNTARALVETIKGNR